MIYLLRAAAALVFILLVVSALSGFAHAQTVVRPPSELDIVHDATLPPGVLAVTACNKLTNRPIVITKHWPPEASVMVHEAVHVEQIKRYGGCPRGLKHMVRNRLSLLDIEAEAYCASAYWSALHERTDIRTTLNLAVRGLHQAADMRAVAQGNEWRLSLEEITSAFSKICPQIPEPAHRTIGSDETASGRERLRTGESRSNHLTEN